jgi:hypothetical protein
MTALHEKLDQLSLTTMSQRLHEIIAEAAAKNFSVIQALEALTDSELEARNGRSIERRFRLSRLHAATPSTASTSSTTRAAWS